jgi:hypothetical protein
MYVHVAKANYSRLCVCGTQASKSLPESWWQLDRKRPISKDEMLAQAVISGGRAFCTVNILKALSSVIGRPIGIQLPIVFLIYWLGFAPYVRYYRELLSLARSSAAHLIFRFFAMSRNPAVELRRTFSV